MEPSSKKVERPLSPHIMGYKPQLTSVMSILHRMTGFALAVGTVPFVWLMVATATGSDEFSMFMEHARSWYGLVMLAGWSFALFYHMCNGLRHLLWDAGYGLELKCAYKSGYTVLVVSVCLTIAVWYLACPAL